jgi:hypothetical protein
MKKILFLVCLISLVTSAHTSERTVYGNDFEIIRNSYDGEEYEKIMGYNTVILEENSIEASIQMTSGPSCLFEGVKIEESIYAPTEDQKQYGESCRVILDFKTTEFGKSLSLSSEGNCLSFCGAGAELKASGLEKF